MNEYKLYDVVMMKKYHPCSKRTNLFQIIRVGADIKIMCLGCGNIIMMPRIDFNKHIRRVVSSHEFILEVGK